MTPSDYTLSRPVAISVPAEEIDKLLQARDGQIALVYLALHRAGGKPLRPGALGLSEAELNAALKKLAELGLVSAGGGKAAPAPLPPAVELPQYTSEDLITRMREDMDFQGLVHYTEQKYGRKLSTPETKSLLGMQDHLGLPAAVLMELVTYVFDLFRSEKGPGRTPTMRLIEKEAYAWAREELLTLELAEAYIERQRQRSTAAARLMEAVQIRGRAPSATERKYLLSWHDMGFGPEAVSEAYDRTVLNAGGLKWPYLNKILLSWHERGLHEISVILDEDPRGGKRRDTASAPTDSTPRNDTALAEKLLGRRKNGKE